MTTADVVTLCDGCPHGLVIRRACDGSVKAAACYYGRGCQTLEDRRKSGRDVLKMTECPDRARVARLVGI